MHSAPERASAPPTGSAVVSHRGGGDRPYRTSHRRDRPRRRGRLLAAGAVVIAGLLGCAAYGLVGADGEASDGTSAGTPRPRDTARVAPAPTPTRRASPSPAPSPTKIDVPATGTGTFVAAHATGAKVGRGARPLRYVVEVETGIDLPPARAADEIAGILGAPRGWTHDASHAFRLVSAGEPHDLTVKIATPGTADALCWAGIHQDTGGEYNCETPAGWW